MLAFLFTPIGKALGAAVVAVALFSGAFLYGKSVGRQGAAVEALEATVKAYKDRNDENAAIEALDPVALCVELGAPKQACEDELRAVTASQSHPPQSSP